MLKKVIWVLLIGFISIAQLSVVSAMENDDCKTANCKLWNKIVQYIVENKDVEKTFNLIKSSQRKSFQKFIRKNNYTKFAFNEAVEHFYRNVSLSDLEKIWLSNKEIELKRKLDNIANWDKMKVFELADKLLEIDNIRNYFLIEYEQIIREDIIWLLYLEALLAHPDYELLDKVSEYLDKLDWKYGIG